MQLSSPQHHAAQFGPRHRSAAAAAPRRALVRARASATSSQVESVKRELLEVVSRTGRGVSTSPADLRLIQEAVAELRRAGADSETTDPSQSGTWELLWTSEKETLFILERAPLFGTQTGAVYQVIDTTTSGSGSPSSPSSSGGGGSGFLQNVITFPPEGAFIVDSSLAVAGRQRVEFGFTAAKLKLPGGRALGLPPFGKGWFDNLYLDGELRVSYDSRGDTLITRRAGPPRRFT
ncbi:hypothetical protein PLESTB_001795200 [Pleodorina starrii]|uniref:Plastid lipid-associated protein/fibrillin conserved domain-containing protein n=1 Tax=Pleodorina starrii TaxID=330485 RepID=A0A9W6C229_9CHLO|nr:hypothetical protein PLESTM_001159500 [Pleodorina starrii]GLC61716.1 hypothetical protein PLESTB_001795200 [Pleodorina starrii]GLC69195.1 hypothetical protein PLESTF_000800800 [Pleodorina starrii]